MKYNKFELNIGDIGMAQILKDPLDDEMQLVECVLPFEEAAKLKRGNANVRPPQAKKRPYRAMMGTVEEAPQLFHLKNRGITYICADLELDNKGKHLVVSVPSVSDDIDDNDERVRYGIADGGHTYEVVTNVVANQKDYEAIKDWQMPYVRVHFLVSKQQENVESIVEALNTSLQVQQYTLDEYQNKFILLKEALEKKGFDPGLVAFRENEDKEWHVVEVIQRMACFLKDRWVGTQPAGMYKSKSKALRLYTNQDTRSEFSQLFPVIRDIITLPEFIQGEFSKGDFVPGRSLGKLKCVKPLKKAYTRPGTNYETNHKIDLAGLLPLAAGFRELLVRRNGEYHWRLPYKDVFAHCAKDLYHLLSTKTAHVAMSNQLSSDTEFWSGAVTIISRAKDELLDDERPTTITRKKKKVEDDEETPKSDGHDKEELEATEED